jgi:hypothetical protein
MLFSLTLAAAVVLLAAGGCYLRGIGIAPRPDSARAAACFVFAALVILLAEVFRPGNSYSR